MKVRQKKGKNMIKGIPDLQYIRQAILQIPVNQLPLIAVSFSEQGAGSVGGDAKERSGNSESQTRQTNSASGRGQLELLA